jgi:outer membrane protein assembly factor BamB
VCGLAISEDKSQCVCGSESGILFGLEAESGREIWRHTVGHAIRTIPLVHKRYCIVPAYDGLLHCVEMPVNVWAGGNDFRFSERAAT